MFRDQGFGDVGFERQKEIARRFRPLHVYGLVPHPVKGSDEHIYDHIEFVLPPTLLMKVCW